MGGSKQIREKTPYLFDLQFSEDNCNLPVCSINILYVMEPDLFALHTLYIDPQTLPILLTIIKK